MIIRLASRKNLEVSAEEEDYVKTKQMVGPIAHKQATLELSHGRTKQQGLGLETRS